LADEVISRSLVSPIPAAVEPFVEFVLNRFFRNQPLMAEKCYRPQMQMCDMVVDTTGAAIWKTPEIARILMS
jgi:hypothetical protein